jgi:hypothetical protein
MERLTSSERIVDMYGHCGTSIFAENMKEDVTRNCPQRLHVAKKISTSWKRRTFIHERGDSRENSIWLVAGVPG